MRLCWVLLLGVLIVSGTVRSSKPSKHSGDKNDDKEDNNGDASGDGNNDNDGTDGDKDTDDDNGNGDDHEDDDDDNGARFLIPMIPAVFLAGTVLRLIG